MVRRTETSLSRSDVERRAIEIDLCSSATPSRRRHCKRAGTRNVTSILTGGSLVHRLLADLVYWTAFGRQDMPWQSRDAQNLLLDRIAALLRHQCDLEG